jgi:hypothetical protein
MPGAKLLQHCQHPRSTLPPARLLAARRCRCPPPRQPVHPPGQNPPWPLARLQKLIVERGGNAWDTVKPLQRYFADLSRVLLIDDSPHKSLPAEASNMLVMPRCVLGARSNGGGQRDRGGSGRVGNRRTHVNGKGVAVLR